MSRTKNVYFRNYFISLRIHASSTRIYALRDLVLIKLIVYRFMGTGGFLIRYSKGRTK